MKRISLPFRVGGDGGIAHTSASDGIAVDQIKTVVLTAFGERLMLPQFGSSIPAQLFAGMLNDDRLADAMRDEINRQLTNCTLKSMKLSSDGAAQSTLNIAVEYATAISPQSSAVITT